MGEGKNLLERLAILAIAVFMIGGVATVATAATGDTCEEAEVITSPGMYTCPGADGPNDQYWYSYTPSSDCLITISSDVPGASVDTRVFVYDACGGNLVAYDDDGGSVYYSLASVCSFVATGGVAYKICWDGYWNNVDPFDWELTESPIPDGVDCDHPIVVNIPDDLDYYTSDTTCGKVDDYSYTDLGFYDNGDDIIYKLVVTEDTTVHIKADCHGEDYTGMGLFDDCPDVGNLLASDTNGYGETDPLEITYTLLASESPYYLMLDSWPSPQCYDFDLLIEIPKNDVGVTGINSPWYTDDCGTLPVNVEVTNFGPDVTDVPVRVVISQGVRGATLLDEDFEGSFPPAGWTVINNGGDCVWQRNDYWGRFNYMYTGYCADADSDACGYGTTMDTELWTPPLDLSPYEEAYLKFQSFYLPIGCDYCEVLVSPDGGSTWEQVWYNDRYMYGDYITIDLSPYTYSSNVIISFHYVSTCWAWFWLLDNVEVWAPSTYVEFYNETTTVDLLSGEVKNVDLPDWTCTSPGYYDITACTELSGDNDPANDCYVIKHMPIGDLDIGVSSIDIPRELMGPIPFKPTVTVENYGNIDVKNAPVHCMITTEPGNPLVFDENFETLWTPHLTNQKVKVIINREHDVQECGMKLLWEDEPDLGDPNDWTVYDFNFDGITWHPTSYRYSSPITSMYCGDDATHEYAPSSYEWMISPQINVGPSLGGTLEWDMWMEIEPYWDFLYVGNSPDGYSFYGRIYYLNTDGWEHFSQELYPDYIAPDGTTYVCFLLWSDSSVQYEGVYIDNVRVYASGVVYDEYKEVDLNAGQIKQVEFPEFTPEDCMYYNITVCTELPFDEESSNNCAGPSTFYTGARVWNTRTGYGYDNIQDAIDDPATIDGDTIVARDGEDFYENINIWKGITVTGQYPPSGTTTIYGTVDITHDNVVFQNFKVIPPFFTSDGAAVQISASHVTVQNNIIENIRGEVSHSTGSYSVYGIKVVSGSDITIFNNTIRNIMNGGILQTSREVLFYEGFEDGVIPPGWYTVIWSGTGDWEIHEYGGPTYYEPPGTGSYFATADSDTYFTDVFDVSLFTPPIDLSGYEDIKLSIAHAFEDCGGCGEAHIAVWSGGSLDYVVHYMTEDGDDGKEYGGSIQNFSIDKTLIRDPTSVQFEFWYSTNGGTYCWSYSIDDINITGTPMPVYGGAVGIKVESDGEDINILENEIYDIHSAGWSYGVEVASPAEVSVISNYFTGIGDGTVYDVWSNPDVAPFPGVMVAITNSADATEVEVHKNVFDPGCHSKIYAIINKDSGILDATDNWYGMPNGPASDPYHGDVVDPVTGQLADGYGCSIYNFGPVHFDPWVGVHAEASASTLYAKTGETIIFDAEGSFARDFDGGYEPIYYWSFGDGTYSSNKQIGHAYQIPGTYEVYLRVQGHGIPGLWSNFMYDWAYLTIVVTEPGTPLTANADAKNFGGYETIVGEPIQLFGSASGGTPPYTFFWDLGDGRTSTEQNPIVEYKEPGTYTVTLTVTDSELNTATDTAQVVVHDIASLIARIVGPSNAMAGELVIFNGRASGGVPPYSYFWDFGDGTTSTEENPHHVYERPGTYTVTLTVTDSRGNEATDTMQVTVKGETTTEVEIKEIRGGLGVSATISAGDEPVDWQIDVTGGILVLHGHASGTIPAGTEETVRANVFGFGKVTIHVCAGSVCKDATATLIGPLVLNLQVIE